MLIIKATLNCPRLRRW